jgi:hypothetical protein
VRVSVVSMDGWGSGPVIVAGGFAIGKLLILR